MALKIRVQVKTKRKIDIAARLKKRYKREFQNTMRKVGQTGVNNIRSEIKKRYLIHSGDMYDSVNYKMTPHGVRFIVDDPAPFLETGIRRHQMKHLMKAKNPIPVDIANAAFRWATPKSMKDKKWIHPGFRLGKGFMSSSVERTRETVAEDLRKMMTKIF